MPEKKKTSAPNAFNLIHRVIYCSAEVLGALMDKDNNGVNKTDRNSLKELFFI